jgi:hypothetical protein
MSCKYGYRYYIQSVINPRQQRRFRMGMGSQRQGRNAIAHQFTKPKKKSQSLNNYTAERM